MYSWCICSYTFLKVIPFSHLQAILSSILPGLHTNKSLLCQWHTGLIVRSVKKVSPRKEMKPPPLPIRTETQTPQLCLCLRERNWIQALADGGRDTQSAVWGLFSGLVSKEERGQTAWDRRRSEGDAVNLVWRNGPIEEETKPTLVKIHKSY